MGHSHIIGGSLTITAALLLSGWTTTLSSTSSSVRMLSHATKRITRAGVVLQVPTTWSLGRQIVISKISATGANAEWLVPQSPPAPGHSHSRYLNTTMFTDSKSILAIVTELGANGNYYRVDFRVPRSDKAALQRTLQSMKLPPIATVTDAIHLLQPHRATHRAVPVEAESQISADRWILAAGRPATAQQGFFLFSSKDNGQHWFIQNESFVHRVFPDLEGMVTMRFWTQKDGIMAEVTGFSQDLLVYRTQNSGNAWHLQRLSYPAPPRTVRAPIIHATHDRLTIAVNLLNGKLVHYVNTTKGQTWTRLETSSETRQPK